MMMVNEQLQLVGMYELSIVENIMCYGSLSHVPPFFATEDVCIGVKTLVIPKGKRSSMYKG